MAMWVKVLATKPEDLSSVPRTHMESRLSLQPSASHFGRYFETGS